MENGQEITEQEVSSSETESSGSPVVGDGESQNADVGLDSGLQELPELGVEDDEVSEETPLGENSQEHPNNVGKEEVDTPGDSSITELEDKVPESQEENLGDGGEEPQVDEEKPLLYPHLQDALSYITEETNKIQKKITELEEKEKIRLGDDFETFMLWSRKREKVQPLDNDFYAFEDAWKKALAMIEPLKPYIENRIYKDVLFSVGLHYIICEPYFFDTEDEEGNIVEVENPLYKKHNIASKAYIISSASDESSSSSIHVTKSLNDGDFIMQDLLRTRYGTWAYSILEQLDIGAVLL